MSDQQTDQPEISLDESGGWLRGQCYACGHRLRFASSGCPQCGEHFHGHDVPVNDVCDCARCIPARQDAEPTR
jgi:hypothetical protein